MTLLSVVARLLTLKSSQKQKGKQFFFLLPQGGKCSVRLSFVILINFFKHLEYKERELEYKERERKKYRTRRGNITRGVRNTLEKKQVLLANLPVVTKRQKKKICSRACLPSSNMT